MASNTTIEIHHRATGTPQDQNPETPDVVLEIIDEIVSARELIRRAVSEHLRKLGHENAIAPSATEEPLRHLYLTEDQIRSQEKSGKIAFTPTGESETESENFEEFAIGIALTAFRTGRFTMLVGGKQIDDLDTPLTFDDQTKVIFLRLVPLAGG